MTKRNPTLVDAVAERMANKLCDELLRYFQQPGTRSLLLADCQVFDAAARLRDMLNAAAIAKAENGES